MKPSKRRMLSLMWETAKPVRHELRASVRTPRGEATRCNCDRQADVLHGKAEADVLESIGSCGAAKELIDRFVWSFSYWGKEIHEVIRRLRASSEGSRKGILFIRMVHRQARQTLRVRPRATDTPDILVPHKPTLNNFKTGGPPPHNRGGCCLGV